MIAHIHQYLRELSARLRIGGLSLMTQKEIKIGTKPSPQGSLMRGGIPNRRNTATSGLCPELKSKMLSWLGSAVVQCTIQDPAPSFHSGDQIGSSVPTRSKIQPQRRDAIAFQNFRSAKSRTDPASSPRIDPSCSLITKAPL